MPKRQTLGTQLAREAGLCVAASVTVFAAVILLLLFLDLGESGAVFGELIEQVLLAGAVAAPLATALAVFTVRRAVQRATARVDGLISTAAAVTVDSVGVRVGETGTGDEIDQLAQTLNALLARIEQGVAAQRQFAADASHELRTPLAAIITALEVARAQDRSADHWAQLADRCLADARRMVELVEALLHITRASVDLREQPPIELQTVLTPLVERWRLRAPQVQLQVQLQGRHQGTEHIALHVEARALEIVFENLVANAVAQTRPGGVVRIQAVEHAAGIRIAVEDEGPGIPLGERQRIFTAFTRGAHAADLEGAPPGLGLGLSIVRRIVQASHGRIFIDDSYRAGARFVMEFEPLRRQAA
jgi:signal transduction histidine kinase